MVIFLNSPDTSYILANDENLSIKRTEDGRKNIAFLVINYSK